jgi:hypothetical protein
MLLLVGCRAESGGPESGGPNPQGTRVMQRDASGADKMFTPLTPEETGVHFVTRWDKPASYDRIFYSQNVGGGVTVADVDRDGLPDFYLTSPSGGARLYRNAGGFRFEEITDAAGLRDDDYWHTGASFIDIDNDGDVDLYQCAYAAANRLYLNDGTGKFKLANNGFGLNFRGASVMMAFCDYDRDGDLDGYLVTAGLPPDKPFRVRFVDGRPVVLEELVEYWQLLYMPGDRAKQVEAGQFDRLFRNEGKDANGNVKFTEVANLSGIQGADIGQAAVWWDFNGDGWPDVYVSNDYWGPDRLYRNNGDGTFTDIAPSSLPHTPWSSMGVDICDANRDGRLDLMATDMAGSDHFRQKVGMGDMSSSGWFLEYGQPRQYPRNTLFVNSGSDRFLEAAFIAGLEASDWTWTARFEDLDNDGWEDVFITNGSFRDFTNSDLNDQAKQQFKQGSPEFFAFWRKQDYRRDLNRLFRNRGDLRFEDVGQQWGFDHLGVSFGGATADLDADGDLDLILNNMDRPAQIYRNNSTEGQSVRIQLAGQRSNQQGLGALVRLKAGGIEQTRYLSSTRGWNSTSELVLHFGVGEQQKAEQVTIHWPSGEVQVVNDLETGRLHRIEEADTGASVGPALAGTLHGPLVANEGVATVKFEEAATLKRLQLVHRETPFDDYKLQPLLPAKLSQLGPGVAVADLNGDGLDDFFLGGAAGQEGQLVVSGKDGHAVAKTNAFADHKDREDMGAVFLDCDGDGDMDLYVASGSGEIPAGDSRQQDRLYRNEGGAFKYDKEALPGETTSNGVVAAADYDRDGDLDLFVGGRLKPTSYPLAPGSTLLRNEGGRFQDVTAEVAPALAQAGMVSGATWTDTDQNGWLDLWLATEWGPVRALRNDGGKALAEVTESLGLASRLGWWNGIRAGDVDRDGDMDFVVTNCGLNTKYHASADHPTSIYYGDFDQSGAMQIVESEYEGEKLFPVRGRSCSSNAMPFLKDRFKTFTEFGVAQLQEIYTPEGLEKAHRFDANTLESGVLVNPGAGQAWEFRPLPRIAQIAPAFGAELVDINGDGQLDLYLAQNSYSPQRETGRMDGGVSLLMLGDGRGGWQPQLPGSTGLVEGGDAKCLALTELNGDGLPDFLVGVNDGAWRAWQMAGDPAAGAKRRWVKVDLRGRAGNPTAVGARLQLLGDGSKPQVREVTAGGGYLSQASSSQWFSVPADATGLRLEVIWPGGATSEAAIPLDEASAVTRVTVADEAAADDSTAGDGVAVGRPAP